MVGTLVGELDGDVVGITLGAMDGNLVGMLVFWHTMATG